MALACAQGRGDSGPNSITNNPSRALKYPLDKHLRAQRHLVEYCFSRLTPFRRVATRFEKTSRNYRAVVTLAVIILWINELRVGNGHPVSSFPNLRAASKCAQSVSMREFP